MAEQITGLWAAMATKLHADMSIDIPGTLRHGQWLLDNGCDGLVPFGTTGEGPSFSGAERLATTEAFLKAGIAADKIALGTGTASIPDTIAITKGMLALGVTKAMVLPPFYFRDVDAQGIEDAFAAIIDGVGDAALRVTAYHIPQVSGVPVPPAVLGNLRRRFGTIVAGVKDSSGDFDNTLAFMREAQGVGVLTGDETAIANLLDAGGVGTICGMVNLVPHLVRAMFNGHSGTEAMKAACACLHAPFFGVLKATLAAQQNDPAWLTLRAPLRAVDPALGARAAAKMAAIANAKAA
jgi:4-hydroxy-tetrahydrodipicolinate synthase